MKFWRKPKSRLTGVSLPVIGGSVSWADKTDEREARARKERADAFAELWEIAQAAHIGVRNDFDNVDGLADVHRQLNILLIQKAPALEPADVLLAQEFLSALEKFIRMLRPLPGRAADQVRDDVVTTRPIRHLPTELESLEEVHARVLVLNESLKQRYREVVFGESA